MAIKEVESTFKGEKITAKLVYGKLTRQDVEGLSAGNLKPPYFFVKIAELEDRSLVVFASVQDHKKLEEIIRQDAGDIRKFERG